jgi:hypothetical protein
LSVAAQTGSCSFRHAPCNATQRAHRPKHRHRTAFRIANSRNIIHVVDLSLRKLVLALLESAPTNTLTPASTTIASRSGVTMSQPAPFGTKEKAGWWARPKAFITLVFVIGSVCGHTLSGATLPPKATSIPAADLTHCIKCMPDSETWAVAFPIANIPTVVGSVCKHALSGISTPIRPTTITAVATKLCTTCTAFCDIASLTSANYKEFQDTERDYKWTYLATALVLRTPGSLAFMNPQEEEIVTSKLFGEYLGRRKYLARCYEKTLLAYELSVRRLQELVDPAHPIVSQYGEVLLPLPAYQTPVVGAQAGQPTARHVTFDENQQHPSRETARRKSRYRRPSSDEESHATAYRPGKYADTTGKGWENTSKMVPYTGDGSSANDQYMRPFGFEERDFWQEISASPAHAFSVDDTPARGSSSAREGIPFSWDQVIYTPSSLPPQPKKAKQDPREASSVSEK